MPAAHCNARSRQRCLRDIDHVDETVASHATDDEVRAVDARTLFWWRWLLVAALATGLFGLSMVLLPETLQAFFNLLIFGTTWQPPEFGAAAGGYIGFVYGVLGAVLAGWALTIVLALFGPFRRGDKEGWLLIALPLALWFVVDTTWSLTTGYWQNAALNCVFALAYAVPLAATWKRFATPRA